jgi:NAD(P)-dependent dehydrogenase (short-subunit alcohol dehydrogenase family)
MSLEGRIVLITGGSNGIGEATGKKFLREGAKVIVFDQEAPSYDAEYFEVDVRNEEEITEALQQVEELNVLVNNAGIYRHTHR